MSTTGEPRWMHKAINNKEVILDMLEQKVVLEVSGLTKTYPGVRAVDHMDLILHKGEVLAVVGENGAGKSTLIKMLAGSVKPDSGSVTIDGVARKLYTPTQAVKEGIGTIYQELNFIDTISIAENIFLRGLPCKGKSCLVDYKELYAQSRKVMDTVGLRRDPSTEVSKLSMGEKQLIEVARAISQNAKVVIFDEPTSALTDKEVESLYRVIEYLKENGIGVIYISHKLQEVFHICDSILVIRDGKRIDWAKACDVDQQWVIKNMVGREISDMYGAPNPGRKIGETVLQVNHLCGKGVHDVSFELKKGEILGFYGLMGCGSTEIVRTLYGANAKTDGEIVLYGKTAQINSTKEALNLGVAYLTNDRKGEGLVLSHSCRQNICLICMDQIKGKFGVSKAKETKISKTWVEKLQIKTPTIEKEAGELSGGNQQKVALAKFMNSNPRILIFNEPTRGIDVGTKKEFYKLMFDLLNDGISIILVSTEMPEVLAMSDRIYVVDGGTIKGELSRETASELAIMDLIYKGA